MLAYTNFDHLLVIWTVLSVLGLAAAMWSFRESMLDRKALAGVDDPAKATVNLSSILEELTRGSVHVIFIAVAAISMFIAPKYVATHGVLREAIGYAFVAIPGILGLTSVVQRVMRRRLEHLLSNRT